MKRIILVICLLISALELFAQNLNTEQAKLRNEIKSFLQQEGFVPSIDSDGDVTFKSEGRNYWITVSSEDEVPMYTSLNIGFNKPSGYPSDALKMAAAELNYYKGVKVLCYEDQIAVSAELYVMEAEQFKYAFYTMLKQVKSVAGIYLETCDKFKTISSSSRVAPTNGTSTSTSSSSSQSSSSSVSVARKAVSSKNVRIRIGEQIQLKVTGNSVLLWESDNEQIARVSNSGVVTGVANGSTSVWAHYGTEIKHFRITVISSFSSPIKTKSNPFDAISDSPFMIALPVKVSSAFGPSISSGVSLGGWCSPFNIDVLIGYNTKTEKAQFSIDPMYNIKRYEGSTPFSDYHICAGPSFMYSEPLGASFGLRSGIGLHYSNLSIGVAYGESSGLYFDFAFTLVLAHFHIRE